MTRVRHRRGYWPGGAKAKAECGRGGHKFLYKDIVEDDHIPHLLVDPDWYEPRHPQEFPVDTTDAVALWDPTPDLDDDVGVDGTPLNPDTSYICNATITVAASAGDTYVIVNTPVSYEYGDPIWIELDDTTYELARAAGWAENVTRIDLQAPLTGNAGIGNCVYTSFTGTGEIANYKSLIVDDLGAAHYWALDMTNGDTVPPNAVIATDEGSAMVLQDLVLYSQNGDINGHVGHKGPFRNPQTPVHGAIYGTENSVNGLNTSPTVNTWAPGFDGINTGGGCFWFMWFQEGTGSTTDYVRFWDSAINGNTSNALRIHKVAGTRNMEVIVGGTGHGLVVRTGVDFEPNQWHHFAYMQDGTGLKLYKNGVEDTGTTVNTYGNGTTSWWLNDVWDNAGTGTYVDGQWGWSITRGIPRVSGTCMYTAFAMWENSTITASDIADLYNFAGNSTTYPSEDYQEFTDEYFGDGSTTVQMEIYAHGARNSSNFLLWKGASRWGGTIVARLADFQNGNDPPNQKNVSLGTGTIPRSKYVMQACHIDDPSFNQGAFTGGVGGKTILNINHVATTGTVIGWIKPNAADSLSENERNWFAAGQSSTKIVRCMINGDRPGWGVRRNEGIQRDYLQTVDPLADAKYKLAAGNWYMLAVVQDGTGAKLYMNDVNTDTYMQIPAGSLVEVQNDPDVDNTSWFFDANPTLTQLSWSWGATPGSTSINYLGRNSGFDVAHFAWTTDVLSFTQLNNLYTAAIRTI